MLNDIKRTSLEKCLLLVSAFITATQAMVTADNKSMKRSVDSIVNNTCLSIDCNYTATKILIKMNTEIEPCEDFYQFACGNFIKQALLPDDNRIIMPIYTIANKLEKQINRIIREERSESEPKYIRMPNAFFKACMNETLIESLGTKSMEEISKRLGGWPAVVGNTWDPNNTWTWQETVKKFRHLGFSTDYILSFGVTMVSKYNTRKLITTYYNVMVYIAVHFGANKENALEELKDSLQFEMDLAKISLPSEKRNEFSSMNFSSIREMQNSYPYVQWLDYINALLPEDMTVDENETIIVRVPRFFDDLGKLLNRTDKRIIANYMMWRIHLFSLNFLTEGFIKRQAPYFAVITTIQTQTTRWQKCIDEASSLSVSIGSLYVRKYFNRYSKDDALEMINNIRGIFSQILDEAAWMDDDTKQAAKQKLQSMATFIAYHDDYLDDNKLEKLHSKLKIDPAKYFESSLSKNVFEMDNSLRKLRLQVNKTDWGYKFIPHEVYATYSEEYNVITFPAAIWQGPFYNSQLPMYMNYAAIGTIIGHEIIHGFDNHGSQYDGNGGYVDWWQPDAKSKFLEKVKCIIEQYGNYTDKQTGLNLNGTNTQAENIADNGGVKISYRAYNQWVAKNGQEPRLPNLDYSPQQMFWISYAQSWCAKYTTEYINDLIRKDNHSPSEFRILGPLRNLKDFSRDFQCPEGSPMNPVHKCELW